MSFITFPARIEGAQYKNTGFGFDALYRVTPSPPQGEDNTAFGYAALQLNTSGDSNTAIGSGALSLNISGRKNTAIGENTLDSNSTGEFNTSIGAAALSSATDADYNVSIGANSLLNFSAAGLTYNTAVGAGSGQMITTGTKNTILGRFNGNQGGLDIRTASNYCVISDGDGNPRIIVDPTGLVSAPGGFSGGGGGAAITINNKTGAYTVVSGDLGEIINCTANTFTVSLTAAATLGSGFNCWVWNTGAGAITIDPNGAETIDGRTTLVLQQGEGTQIVCDGTNWLTGSKKTMRAYAENIAPGTTRPSVTGSGSVAIGLFSQAAGSDSIAIGGLSIAGNAQTLALGYGTQANPSYSCAIGQNSSGAGSQTATNFGAMALGGSRASGADSFAAAISSNTSSYGATGQGAVAMGQTNLASGSSSLAIGGAGNTANGAQAAAVGGVSNTASGVSSFVSGSLGTSAGIETKAVFSNGFSGVQGSSQFGLLTLKRTTTNATPLVMNVFDGTPGVTNQVILPNNSAFTFTGTIVARQQASGGTQSAAWRVEGLIRREANAASTTLVASTVTVISNVPGWTLALSADTTNGGLAVTATGAAATNIRWVASLQTSETIYA